MSLYDKKSIGALLITRESNNQVINMKKIIKEKSRNEKFHYINVYIDGLIHETTQTILKEIMNQIDLEGIDTKTFPMELETKLLKIKQSQNFLIFHLKDFDVIAQKQIFSPVIYTLFSQFFNDDVFFMLFAYSPRSDAVDLLEKRVKSRFIHTIYCVEPKINFEQYTRFLHDLLIEALNQNSTMYNSVCNNVLPIFFQSLEILAIIKGQFFTTNYLEIVKNFLLITLMNWTPSISDTVEDLKESLVTAFCDNNRNDNDLKAIYFNLNRIEKFIIQSALLQEKKYDDLNFNIIYKEFRNVCISHHFECTDENVAFKILEKLLSVGIFIMHKEFHKPNLNLTRLTKVELISDDYLRKLVV
ncbi:hypothetical protein A3Q56_01428 [Intoshia linei]|uniref:Uncharacterized protein n=1 Tax=Intoshia linei TaxID=1819745 RepID=A0A177B941_9BILA|nr:hypothetical protein A3Q56_01428 [Intoshia linei]